MSAKRRDLFEDSLAGSALGLFAGDALGASIEGLAMIPLRQHLGWVNEMLNGRYPPGTYTDDTQVMIGILEALDEDDALPSPLLANILAHNHEEKRGYGASTGETLARLRQHEIPVTALSRDSYGNGGAMGVAPLGVYFSGDLARVVERAAAVCRTTHKHDEAVGGAIAVATAAALMTQARLQGETLEFQRFLDRLLNMEAVASTPMGRALNRLDELPLRAPPHVKSAYLAGTFDCTLRAVESVPIAIGAAFAASSLREAIEVAVNSGGDTDTQGAMAGGIAGAYFGEKELPASWQELLENGFKGRDYVRALVRRLASKAASN